MKWLKRTLLLWMLLLGMAMPAFAGEDSCKLYLDVSFKENRFMNKYDVGFSLDGGEAETLKYGKPFTKMTSVSPGKHTISFFKIDDPEISVSEEIDVQKDCSYRCEIQTDSKEIRILESYIEASLEGSSIKMPDLQYARLSEAVKILSDEGFLNISGESENGKTVSKEEDWIVISQNVKEGEARDKNDEIVLACKKTSEFLEDTFTGKTVSQAVDKAKTTGFEIEFIDALNSRDIRTRLSALSEEERDQWVVEDAEAVPSNKKVALLYMRYEGNSIVPDVAGMGLPYAIEELRQSGFTDLKYESESHKGIKDKDAAKWKVVSQSVNAGTDVSVQERILLVCEKYADLEEETLFSFPKADTKVSSQAAEDKEAGGKPEENPEEKSEEKPEDKTEEKPEEVKADEKDANQ